MPRPRRSFARAPLVPIRPNLIQLQQDSFAWLIDPEQGGIRQLFDEIGGMGDHAQTVQLDFGAMSWGEPSLTPREARIKDLTYARPLHVQVSLLFLDTGEVMEQSVFFGDMPWMTERGTFVVGGTERVIINQLVRAPGAYIMPSKDPGKLLQAALMPSRGSWLDMELDRKGRIQARIDRKRRFPYTILLSALGYSREEVLEECEDSLYMRRTYEEAGEHTLDADAAAVEIFKKQRPGEPPSVDNARALVDSLFFDSKRYDLTRVGRYKLNSRLNLDLPSDLTTLDREDLLHLGKVFVGIPRALGIPEDDQAPLDIVQAARGRSMSLIDSLVDEYEHFANRRVRAVGELVQESMRTGWSRSERAIRERLTVQERSEMTPQSVVNVRPFIASIKEFFGSSALSQFMDQDNALAGLTHRRRLSGLGPGGLSRERAPLEVRDVHPTHYGRMCPIETPEGPNIGLIGSLTAYASVNGYGFLTTPYFRVEKGKVTNQIVWIDASEEAKQKIAPASVPRDSKQRINQETVVVRTNSGHYLQVPPEEVDLIDISPNQLWSVATGLIPFLEHDDANRALMGSNMQRQAVPGCPTGWHRT
jgi:DNA-directed RNA polymerase subunit beta